MYELDIRVREHDPAWPLLAVPPENKSVFRSLPSVPKLVPQGEFRSCDTNEELEIGQKSNLVKAVISESRDPRLNRKRKASPQKFSQNQDEFLIDRSGDMKMEAVARKQGKRDEASDVNKLLLFGGQDMDMRAQTPAALAPTKSLAWTSYIDKHSEISSRREPKDVDMRFGPSVSSSSTTNTVFHNLGSKDILSVSMSSCNENVFIAPTQTPVDSNTSFVHTVSSISDLKHHASVASVNTHQSAGLSKRFYLDDDYDDKFLPEFSRQRILEPPPYLKTAVMPHRGPPIRGPVWSVEINGFPDMIDIGIDPRMLSLVNHPKPPRRITVDGHQYPLLLDRVQPLILIGDRIHAVRFRCEVAIVVIDGRCFEIPGTGFTKVIIGNRCFTAYLGGPGHELVIDGRPHTVPLTSHLTYINVGYHSVGVKFVGKLPRNINVLPPIPPRLLKWAGQGLFGSPRHLNLAPLSPLNELARLAEEGHRSKTGALRSNSNNFVDPGDVSISKGESVNANSNNTSVAKCKTESFVNSVVVKTSDSVVTSVAEGTVSKAEQFSSNTNSTPDSKFDVHELFQKLVKAGIVPSAELPKPTEPPELGNYNWERFKVPFDVEVDGLYCGHQCSQCGLRFKNELSPEFAKHLDYHYMKNSSNSQDRRYSRNFYQSLQYWLISEMTRDGASDFEPQSPIRNLQEYRCPSFADSSKNVSHFLVLSVYYFSNKFDLNTLFFFMF